MRRIIAVTVSVLLASTVLAGCQRVVEVQTGVRVECPYGHVDEDGVKTAEVPAKDASAYRVRVEKRVCDRHAVLAALYGEAQAALGQGDLKTAKAKLTEISAQEPGFRRTAEQLDAMEKGRTPSPDTDPAPSRPATSTPKPGETDTNSPAGSLKKYTPDSLEGFTARPILVEPLAVTREYDPKASNARLLTIVAEQFNTAAAAQSALNRQMAYYPESAATVTAGSRRVKFGSDGRRFVSVSFTEGAVLVIIELAAADGTDPVKLKGAIVDVAAALP